MENSATICGGEAGLWAYVLVPLTFSGSNIYRLGSFQEEYCRMYAWKQYVVILGIAFFFAGILSWCTAGGCAWRGKNNKRKKIPGPRGWPIIRNLVEMSGGHAHRKLAHLAYIHKAKKLMVFSLGSTRAVITSDSEVARELLSSPNFADRPLKQSEKPISKVHEE
ncbi:hypothetical protein SUGI_1020100 [Cryptomeria japonica]|nr:hypothetical protein SUGI_1020100 [Cryptomeria japonica]